MIILKKVYNYFKILALDITIYLLSILFALMYRYVFSKVLDTLSGSTWASGIALFFIINTLTFLCIVILPTLFYIKKDKFDIISLLMTAVIFFLLFSMYTPPFLYLFVFTDSITGFLFNVLQMSKLKSSILISFQYSIIIFLTAKIHRVKAT